MTDIKYGGMMCPHGHVKAACAICATPPKSPPMTDPKPATPATDDYVPDYPNWGFGGGSHLEYQAQLAWESRYGLAVDSNPVIKLIKQRARLIRERDERDDIIKAARQERDAVKEALVEARETIRKQAEEIESQKHQLEANHEWEAKQADEIERLKGAYKIMGTRFSALATAREQVRTLREALKMALGHCDCSDYNSEAMIPCTEANPCAGCYTTRTGQTALAAILRSAGRIPLTLLGADEETIKAERASADKYEAESEQKGADLMAAEAVIESLKADAAQWDAIIKDNDVTRTIRDLRETIRKQAEEIEAKEQEIRGLMFEKTPMLLTIDIANQELATARAQIETLREALIRLRDCDWVISLPDRMDAVRDIARAALAATEPKG